MRWNSQNLANYTVSTKIQIRHRGEKNNKGWHVSHEIHFRHREIADQQVMENAHHPAKQGERKRGAASCARVKRTSKIVAQMKFRARDFHRSPSLSLFSPWIGLLSSLFCAGFFYFASPTEHIRGSGKHFRLARPRPTCRRCAGEYLSERKTNSSLCIHPFYHSPPSHAHRGKRAGVEVRFVCGKKSLSVERAAAARIALFARGMLRGRDVARGGREDTGEEGGEERGSKKHRAHTRRTSANISSGQPPIFSTPSIPSTPPFSI